MADYVSAHTGTEIDEAVEKVLHGGVPLLNAEGKVPDSNLPSGIVKVDETGKVPPAQIPDAEYVLTTMLASKWEGNKYSFEEEYPHERYNIEAAVADTATKDEFEAAGKAMIGSSATSNVFTALGGAPAVDIPVVVKVVAK